MRLLDVGCGWGSLALHAARQYGAEVVGITLSTEQADLARERVADAGLDDRITIRVQDYREVDDGPFDAMSSIGMAEHVGRAAMAGYVAALHGLLRPGGRLLNHAIAWAAGRHDLGRRHLHRPLRLPRRRAAPPRRHDRGARGADSRSSTSRPCAGTTR